MGLRVPTETQANALVGGQRLCAHPRGQAIAGFRANLGVGADSIKIGIVAAIEGESQRILARMLLPHIVAASHATRWVGQDPSEPSAGNTGFKSAVPKNRTGRIKIARRVGKTQSIVPDTVGIANVLLLNQKFSEGGGIGEL